MKKQRRPPGMSWPRRVRQEVQSLHSIIPSTCSFLPPRSVGWRAHSGGDRALVTRNSCATRAALTRLLHASAPETLVSEPPLPPPSRSTAAASGLILTHTLNGLATLTLLLTITLVRWKNLSKKKNPFPYPRIWSQTATVLPAPHRPWGQQGHFWIFPLGRRTETLSSCWAVSWWCKALNPRQVPSYAQSGSEPGSSRPKPRRGAKQKEDRGCLALGQMSSFAGSWSQSRWLLSQTCMAQQWQGRQSHTGSLPASASSEIHRRQQVRARSAVETPLQSHPEMFILLLNLILKYLSSVFYDAPKALVQS